MVYQSMHAVPVLDRLQASRLSLNHLGVLLRVAIRDCVALLALAGSGLRTPAVPQVYLHTQLEPDLYQRE